MLKLVLNPLVPQYKADDSEIVFAPARLGFNSNFQNMSKRNDTFFDGNTFVTGEDF